MSLVVILQYLFAVLCVATALYVAFGRNTLRTSIAFFVQIAAAGGVLMGLNADYLALSILAVALAGTILVISFSSIIMGSLKGDSREQDKPMKIRVASILGMALGLASGIALGACFLSEPFLSRVKAGTVLGSGDATTSIHVLGRMMLGSQLVVFEILALVVLVTVIGAGLLLRKIEHGR